MHVGRMKTILSTLLALIGVIAISASAAQAKWLLLRSGTSVSSLNLVDSSGADIILLVPGNGIEIKCTASEGSASISLSEENKKLSGSTSLTFKGCQETEFGEVCETHSSGQPDGTIVASGTRKASDGAAGEEVYLLSLSKNETSTTIEFTGEECPLSEIDGKLTCHWKETILTALKDEKLHVFHVEATDMKIGGEEADLQSETGSRLFLSSITEVTGDTFAIHLIGL